jgi:hypothetical protein
MTHSTKQLKQTGYKEVFVAAQMPDVGTTECWQELRAAVVWGGDHMLPATSLSLVLGAVWCWSAICLTQEHSAQWLAHRSSWCLEQKVIPANHGVGAAQED